MKGERGGGWREVERERERETERKERESERDRYTSISKYYLHLLKLVIFPLTLL